MACQFSRLESIDILCTHWAGGRYNKTTRKKYEFSGRLPNLIPRLRVFGSLARLSLLDEMKNEVFVRSTYPSLTTSQKSAT